MSSKEVSQSSSIEQAISKPWYKHRWPWLLMAGPAIVIVGCIITIYLAFTQNKDTPLVNQQNRQGLMTTRSGVIERPASSRLWIDLYQNICVSSSIVLRNNDKSLLVTN
ncbi:hypothetical protein OURE66S_02874 [Oligella ureolytica]